MGGRQVQDYVALAGVRVERCLAGQGIDLGRGEPDSLLDQRISDFGDAALRYGPAPAPPTAGGGDQAFGGEFDQSQAN